MISPDEPTNPADRCAECARPLAHDQRYCVVCGTRRSALPTRVAVALDDLADPPRPVAGPPAAAAVPEPAADHVGHLIPLARAAAISILLMLGFGSVIGAATTPGGITSLASTIVLALSPSGHSVPTRVAAVTPTGGAGSSGSGSSGGGGSLAAVTTQAQRTVTISASSPSAAPPTAAPSPTPPPPGGRPRRPRRRPPRPPPRVRRCPRSTTSGRSSSPTRATRSRSARPGAIPTSPGRSPIRAR